MNEKRLNELVSQFGDRKILVVGDFYLDGYWEVDQTKSELSLETPWHVNPVVEQRYYPGAAGTVVNNLCALGAGEVYCVGVIGKDAFGESLVEKLKSNGANPDGLVRSADSITPVYLKVMYHGIGDIVMEGPRFDFENQHPMSTGNQDEVIGKIAGYIEKADAVVILDQMPVDEYGVVTSRVREDLLSLVPKHVNKLFYADARTRIGRYAGLVTKPNRFEAKKAVDPNWMGSEVTRAEAEKCGIELSEKTGKPVYLTLGENGLLVVEGDKVSQVPGVPVNQKVDIVGAGDSATAGIVLSLSSGATAYEAGEVGNMVASITITKLGVTGTASPEELLARCRELSQAS